MDNEIPTHAEYQRIVESVHAESRVKHADALDTAARRFGFANHRQYKLARKARRVEQESSRPPLYAVMPARGRGVVFSVRIEGLVLSVRHTERGPVIDGHSGVVVPIRECLVTAIEDIYAPGTRFWTIAPNAGGEGIDVDVLSDGGRTCLADLFGLVSAHDGASMTDTVRFDRSPAGRAYEVWKASQR